MIAIRVIAIVLISIGLIISIIALISDEKLHLTKYTFESEKVTKEFDGFKIVQITDLHNHHLKYRNGNIIDMVKNEKPDVIFLTGDLIDQYTRNRHIEFIRKMFDGFKDIPMFYIDGNHEEYAHKQDEFFNLLKEYKNIVYLKDKNTLIKHNGKVINLTGLRDPRHHFHKEVKRELALEYEKPIVDKLANELEKDRLNILLSHRPQYMDFYADYDFDLIVAGHTHGGQIKLSKPRLYQSGIYKVKDSTLIVSNGVGTNAKLPIRINCPMQLVTITLKSKN